MNSAFSPSLRACLSAAALVLLSACLLVVAGCTVKVDKDKGQDEKQVDIKTPLGTLHVDTQVDPRDVGLPVYPGARPTKGDDDNSARVELGSSVFGLKVIAIAYQSDASREKIVEFYRKEMKPMGEVFECQGDIDLNVHDQDRDREMKCKPESDKTELAVRAGAGHRMVTIRPYGTGTKFAIMYLQTRGEKEPL